MLVVNRSTCGYRSDAILPALLMGQSGLEGIRNRLQTVGYRGASLPIISKDGSFLWSILLLMETIHVKDPLPQGFTWPAHHRAFDAAQELGHNFMIESYSLSSI